MPLQSICFILGQMTFIPAYIYTTRRLREKRLTVWQWLGYLLICPSSAYFYTMLCMGMLYLLISSEIADLLVTYSDFFVLAFSFVLMYIYGRRMGQRCTAARFLYACLYMLAMPFTAVYESLFLTAVIDLLLPLAVNGVYIFMVCRPFIAYSEDCGKTDGFILILLPVVAELMFLLRVVSFIFFNNRPELHRYDNELSIYNFCFAALVLLFIFVAIHIILKNIENAREKRMAADKMHQLSVETIESLVQAVDAKDSYTNGHSIRVARYAKQIAGVLGYEEEKTENLYYIALLHDVGKIGIDDAILRKPGRLTPEEFEVIRSHTVIGSRILATISSMPELISGALYHHERWDGGGYPNGLKGEEIPVAARIIAVADAYDAMSSYRSYRSALSQEQIREEIIKGIGSQFWPAAAEAMLKLIEQDKKFEMRQKTEGDVLR